LDLEPEAEPQSAARAGVEFRFKLHREAAQQRNGRLRAIHALHRSGK
jgi:hypothetical protein